MRGALSNRTDGLLFSPKSELKRQIVCILLVSLTFSNRNGTRIWGLLEKRTNRLSFHHLSISSNKRQSRTYFPPTGKCFHFPTKQTNCIISPTNGFSQVPKDTWCVFCNLCTNETGRGGGGVTNGLTMADSEVFSCRRAIISLSRCRFCPGAVVQAKPWRASWNGTKGWLAN